MTNIVVANEKSVAVSENNLFEKYDFSGMGFENISARDLAIPYISILQSTSPQVVEDSPSGSKAGMLFNTVTQEIISGSEGLPFVPVYFIDNYVEWTPRSLGGGLAGIHDQNSSVVKSAKPDKERPHVLITGSGNELILTGYAYGLMLDREGTKSLGFCVIPFTSMKLKPLRKWRTALYMIKGRPALFKHRALIKTVKEQNKKGTFYNFQIEPFKNTWVDSLLDPSFQEERSVLEEAFDFYNQCATGHVKVIQEQDINMHSQVSSFEDAF